MADHEENKNATPQDKALAYLQKSGIINAYEYLLTSLCENGLPTGNLYEFAALMMLKYEKRMKNQQRKQQLDARQTQLNARQAKQGSQREQDDSPPAVQGKKGTGRSGASPQPNAKQPARKK